VQLKTVFGAAWPGVSEETWLRLARRSFREDESGIPVLDVDPKVGEAVRAAATPDLWPLFKSLGSLPVLAIRGVLSDILSEATFARMQHEKSNLIALSVPNRGHAPLLDEPQCLTAIDAFLGSLNF
jgi:pimeloyl-ACP methyl ester carboxylesterase